MNSHESPPEITMEYQFNEMLNTLVSFLNALERIPNTQNKQCAQDCANAAYRLLAQDYSVLRGKTVDQNYIADARSHISKAARLLGLTLLPEAEE